MEEGAQAASLYPDWCDPGPWPWTYACEQYVEAPIWCTVFLVDCVALWIIAAIVLRQREQDREARVARSALPRAVRARRLWGGVAVAVRLATLAAGGSGAAKWEQVWARVGSSRRDRRQYLSRRDFHLAGVLSRAAGPLLLLACSLLIWFEIDAYLALGLPWFGLGPRAQGAGRFLGFAVELRIFLDYARTAFTDPGRPEAQAPRSGEAPAGASGDAELGKALDREVKQCRYCHVAKPPRCHHCKVCRRCVLKMDHHCPFVNNCVGLRNYRHFIFFLVDLVFGCLLVALSLCPQVPGLVWGQGPTFARKVHVLVAFVVAVVASCALVPFLLFHLQLVVLNKTSLELLGRRPPPRAAAAVPGRGAPEGGAARGALENFAEVCGAPPPACAHLVEGLLLRLVPHHMARLAKRSE